MAIGYRVDLVKCSVCGVRVADQADVGLSVVHAKARRGGDNLRGFSPRDGEI